MTEARLRRLARLWAGRLGLSHVEIEIEVRALEEADNKAECDPSKNYRFAKITFQPWMVGQGQRPETVEASEVEDRWVEKTLVHELLHVSLTPFRKSWVALEEQIHPDAWALYEGQMRNAEEEVVDALAVAITAAFAG